MSKRDYYEVLGVSRSAGEDEIKKAYRRLAKKLHPDSNRADPNAARKFAELQEAYDVLSDRDKRAMYDRFGHATPTGAAPGGSRVHTWSSRGNTADFDLGDLAEILDFDFGRTGGPSRSVFEGIFGRGRRVHVNEVGEPTSTELDVEKEITLTLEQAGHGDSVELKIDEGPMAGQTVSVQIPPAIDDGQRIRLKGKGRSARRGRSVGDLYIVCRIQPHRLFRRSGLDIYLEVPITVSEATLGTKLEMPTLHGPTTVTVPPGTASGTKLRLSGRGIENPRSGTRGDQYAVIKIVPPKRLTARQERLMTEFRADERENPRSGLW